MIHNIAVFQTNTGGAEVVEGSEILYVRQTSTYYLAQFNMSVDEGTPIEYTITYTDGVDTEVIFTDHEYAAAKGDTVPAFTGVTVRANHVFQGWYLEGGSSSSLYSDADIAAMTVTGDMTFHAFWIIIPEYEGTIKIVLNGTYDTVTQTLLTGTLVDLTTILGSAETVIPYVSADGNTYLLLDHDATGVYSAVLKNGTYHIYYLEDDTYQLLSDQALIMENQNRTRYLFYNSVTYNLNGGTLEGSSESFTEYHTGGSGVTVYDTAPVREGYLFAGWKSADGTVYQANELLSESIGQAYTLTAQWTKAMDVYVHIKINHIAEDDFSHNNDDAKHNIGFTIDAREGDSGDYTEMYAKKILWNGSDTYAGTDYSYAHIEQNGNSNTIYVAQEPNLTNVPSDWDYTVTTTKSGYTLKSVEEEYDEDGNLQIYMTLIYDPANFDLVFSVELDAESKALPSSLWPAAVNVKVTSWYDTPYDEDYGMADDDETVTWHTITQQRETYERITLDASGQGSGSYPVAIRTTTDNPEEYYYRIEVVSYELPDGTIVPAKDVENLHITYESEDKHFYATIEVTDGADPDLTDTDILTGAWHEDNVQKGTVKAIVSIPVYTVTFIPNGGTLNDSTGNTVLEKQEVVPNLTAYVPTRENNYVFDGWYLADANGEMTGLTVASGDALTADITLIAKWKPPVDINGIVTVAATYDQTNEDGSVTIQYIHEIDRTTSEIVLLQKLTPSGYYETIDQAKVTLDYTKTEYYFLKNGDTLVPVGVGSYHFTGLPDDGSQYRIHILSANYSSTYQNEPESVDTVKRLQYNTYGATDYDALYGETDPGIATVNAHLHFTPPSFDLLYQVDASAIGESFRPDSVEILVTYDGDPAIVTPSEWQVISQMVFGAALKGCDTALTAGIGNGSVSVWKSTYDSSILYDYGLRVGNITTGDTTAGYADNPYYKVAYQAPAYYAETTGSQNQLLIAYLVPKTYSVTYEANGGTIFGTHVHSHTWSHETTLSEVIPVRSGYEFLGWYLDRELTTPLNDTVIDASVASDTTFYAKWQQALDDVYLEVIIDHTTTDNGLSSDYDKLLNVQLTRRLREDTTADFLPVNGQTKSYDNTNWHTHGNIEQDVLEVPRIFTNLSGAYDYSLDVSLEGYYVDTDRSSVEKISNADGSTTHYVEVYLQFTPDLLDLTFTVEMADDVNEALYPVSADVKVTCWYKPAGTNTVSDWCIITQHRSDVVEVALDAETGTGTGTCQVWQWLEPQSEVPYYYRIQVVSLELSDGTVLPLEEKVDGTIYAGGGYYATIYAENGCELPKDMDSNGTVTTGNTALTGAYGTVSTDDTDDSTTYLQNGTLKAVIDVSKVIFHANNENATCHDKTTGEDTLRTYYPIGATLPEGEYYHLNTDGSISSFYDIPEFAYLDHNDYIFKGWYTAADKTGTPIVWTDNYYGDVDIYAHWIEVDTVAKEAADTKQTGSDTYPGYDLIGAQIRNQGLDEMAHYGNPASGLRFITVLSEAVYDEINALKGNESGAEYGFVVAKSNTAARYAGDTPNYTLQYKGENVNGINTTTTYKYVLNMKCSGVVDHYDGEAYRLYTAVITYNNLTGDALEAAYTTPFVARSYLRYYDANSLLRTYYNNYTGTEYYGGCSTSFAAIRDVVANTEGGASQ